MGLQTVPDHRCGDMGRNHLIQAVSQEISAEYQDRQDDAVEIGSLALEFLLNLLEMPLCLWGKIHCLGRAEPFSREHSHSNGKYQVSVSKGHRIFCNLPMQARSAAFK